jgi:predicted AlkP superfamily phosphohydrolase/phosphomutase
MKKVIAVGLDAAEPRVIERWMAEGKLPNMQRIKDLGIYTRLDNFEESSVETSWTTFATGSPPEKTGYYGPLVYGAENYRMVAKAAYDYEEYPPFYALGDDYRVIAFDMPQVRLNRKINGLQVAAWGAHSPQVEQGSLPEHLFEEILKNYGDHPGLHRDYACIGNFKKTMEVQEWLQEGIKRRTRICLDLIKNEQWDLLMTVFGESHAAMHTCWHLSQEDHPLYEQFQKKLNGRDPMLESFQLMDKAIGEMRTAAPADTQFIVYSLHGMGPAFMDLSTLVFLPEYLYRYNFPGKQALGDSRTTSEKDKEVIEYDFGFWERHIWNTKYEPSLFKWLLKKYLPNKAYVPIAEKIDPIRNDDLVSPFAMTRLGEAVGWNPAHWYYRMWPRMKAFAIPTFGEGFVRLNVKGRDPQGIIEPDAFEQACDEITEMLMKITDAEDGENMVKNVVRTRDQANHQNANGHFADLIILMKDKRPPSQVVHPDLGSIGPLPRYRSGTHRNLGIFLGCGSDIEANISIEGAHVLGVAPTILRLLGAVVPAHMSGKSCFEQRASGSI